MPAGCRSRMRSSRPRPDPAADQGSPPDDPAAFAAGQVTRARKLEGAWWAHGGQVWFYCPITRRVTLRLRFGVNPDPMADGAHDGPDDITVSPYGGVIIAEDGDGVQHLLGATDEGETYPLARDDINLGTPQEPEYSEFTGPTFSPDGRVLFASVQTPASRTRSPGRGRPTALDRSLPRSRAALNRGVECACHHTRV